MENKEYRKQVVIEVVGPIAGRTYAGCRKSLGGCGTLPRVYHIVGLTREKGPWYFECPNCGMHEVVSGTPMNFGEVVTMSKLIKE